MKTKLFLSLLLVATLSLLPLHGMSWLSSWWTAQATDGEGEVSKTASVEKLEDEGSFTFILSEDEQLPENMFIFGTASRSGKYKFNEDCYFPRTDSMPCFSRNGLCYEALGVFDGCFGKQAADYAAKKIISVLSQISSEISGLTLLDTLKLAFQSIHQEIYLFSREAGTTVLLLLLQNRKKVHIAHAGNSLAILQTVHATAQLTQAHTLNNYEELSRVNSQNIFEKPRSSKPYLLRYSSVERAIKHKGEQESEFWLREPASGRTIIATRGLGHLLFCPNFIIQPEFRSFSLNGSEKFLILATQGLWNVMSVEAAVSIVEEYISTRHISELDARVAAQLLVDKAWELFDHDDITATVLLFTKNLHKHRHLRA